MNTTFWVMLLKPFLTLIFFALVIIPIKLGLQRIIPDGKIKRLLFRKIGG